MVTRDLTPYCPIHGRRRCTCEDDSSFGYLEDQPIVEDAEYLRMADDAADAMCGWDRA